jgi:ectoine hydroxylase-related dioxygenase (phytanoyl-CoA dioxygenase family)
MAEALLGQSSRGESPAVAEGPSLTAEEIRRFHYEGYLGPFQAVTPKEMARIRHHIDTVVLQKDGPNPGTRRQSRHLDSRVVYDLATNPAIIGRMRSLYGPDLILWNSNFFVKEAGGAEIPWHQDMNFWPLEPLVSISAWIAIDDSKVDNSCVQLIPGSHKKSLPHVKSTEGMDFKEMADPASFSTKGAVNMELEPGEFFLFNERTLHHSDVNRSDRRRLGLAVRVTIPIVRVERDGKPPHPGHATIVVSGRDTMGFKRFTSPPEMP